MKYFNIKTPISEINTYLLSKKWIAASEQITFIEKPGEGNMNVVLRITTNLRSFILKQSRPYVQKYQQIEAPLNRIAVEYQFYQTAQSDALNTHIPKIIGYDESQHVLLLEDLGNCDDMTSIYQNQTIDPHQLKKLVEVLVLIHKSKIPHDFPQNMKMRQLNHQHIFVLPFMENNGFHLNDIQEGLQELSKKYKTNTSLKSIINEIGQKYLAKGNTLVHGDYYPGSWMTKAENIYIIDPEFGFSGFAEFDLGVMAAHIIMATSNERYLDTIYNSYSLEANKTLMMQITGIEIMRRLIGLAQLPLERTLSEKQYLLSLAHKMIIP